MRLHIQEVVVDPSVEYSDPYRTVWYLMELDGAPSAAEVGQVALDSAASPQHYHTSSWEGDRAVAGFASMAVGWSARRLAVEGSQQYWWSR